MGEIREGDVVAFNGVRYRVESLRDGWAHFLPVRKDGERDQRRTPFSGRLDERFRKVEG